MFKQQTRNMALLRQQITTSELVMRDTMKLLLLAEFGDVAGNMCWVKLIQMLMDISAEKAAQVGAVAGAAAANAAAANAAAAGGEDIVI